MKNNYNLNMVKIFIFFRPYKEISATEKWLKKLIQIYICLYSRERLFKEGAWIFRKRENYMKGEKQYIRDNKKVRKKNLRSEIGYGDGPRG